MRNSIDLETLKNTPPWQWPEGAGAAILAVLGDAGASEADRALAAQMAGDTVVVNEDLVASLLSIVASGEESEQLRAKAAISLGPVLEQTDIDGFDDPDDVLIGEDAFQRIRDTLGKLYKDRDVPKLVRRRILEASVRAPENWHADAVRAAYLTGDEEWKLTAVFAMRWVRGFQDVILEALDSENPDLRYEAVCAAGECEVDAAWPRITELVASPRTDKALRLAAIGAVASIRPDEAGAILGRLADSNDPDIAEAAAEAIEMAELISGDDLDDEGFVLQ